MTAPTPPLLPGVPLVESPFFARHFEHADVDPLVQRLARDLRDNGYAVFDFPTTDFDTLADQVIADLSPRFDLETWRRRKATKRGGLRAPNALESAAVREIATNQAVCDLLQKLVGRRPFPFQTLDFPVGTDQHYHTDSIHFSSIPARFMVGVWVALEDISADQGPLYYFPGSHKLPVYENHHYGVRFAQGKIPPMQSTYEAQWEQLVEACGLREEIFTPKKGQALIWLANLLHGGKEHRDLTKTRWSQVTHYYFDDCAYYTPMHSDMLSGVICFREPMDISTGERRKNMADGQPVPRPFIEMVTPDLDVIDPVLLPRDFVSARYLELNPDLKQRGMNPAHHYACYGEREGRRYV